MTDRATPRYVVVRRSVSAHCCFESTVVDRHRPRLGFDGKPQTDEVTEEPAYEPVCESFEHDDAAAIALALNAM